MAVFARVGVPDEILTDQGYNFMSALMKEVYQLLKIRRIRTTPYHPQMDNLVERFNATLKAMLTPVAERANPSGSKPDEQILSEQPARTAEWF